MNIFVLDESPIISAQMQCDKHIVKMPLETAQMLCSVLHRHGQGDKVLYKEAHKNHPCTLWTGDSVDNFIWLWKHGMELCFEYTRRYNKIHKSSALNGALYAVPDYLIRSFNDQDSKLTKPPLCMPEHYKHKNIP